MNNAESERIRDLVLLWHMKHGSDWVDGYDTQEEIKSVLELKAHEYLQINLTTVTTPKVRLNNKALKLIGAQQHDTQN